VVCYCFSVTARTIRDLVEKNGLETVDQVTNYCKAGGGCGGCKGDIQAIIDDVRGKAAAASDATGDRVESGPPTLTNLQKMTLIQKTVDEVIRPALQNDGGDLELVDIRDDIVEVRLQGSCAGCPGAQMTLKRWVEAQLREKVLPTLVVQQVPQR
jgi:NifU-like protein